MRKVIQTGNPAYTIFKSFYGIATGFILSNDKLFKNTDPIQSALNELKDSKLIDQSGINLLDRCFNRSSHESLELSSMNKLLGHPEIQTLEGIDKLRSRTDAVVEAVRQKISDLLSSMKMNFIHQ